MVRWADRMARLGTETAFEQLAKAKALEAKGQDIVHLEIGEPDFSTPEHIVESAIQALRDGFHHYTPTAGSIDARKSVARYVGQRWGVDVTMDNVVISPGSKPQIFFSIIGLIQPGDEAIYPNPGYPIYESMINFSGGKAVPYRLIEEKGFRFDLDEVVSLVNDKTRMIVLNSPQNPTGGVLTKEDIEGIAAIARERDLVVLSDEIYSRVMYDGKAHESIFSLPGMAERTILLDGLSKAYAMCGWRLGFGVMPAEIAKRVTQLQTNCTSNAASFTQIAMDVALHGTQKPVEAFVDEFKRRRDTIVDCLNDIPGVSCHRPLGAFYVFPNVKSFGRPSQELCDYLLNEAGVAGLSGTAFGSWGEGYLRFSYANSVENIEKGMGRVKVALAKLGTRG